MPTSKAAVLDVQKRTKQTSERNAKTQKPKTSNQRRKRTAFPSS
jgi:hypothetical protein